MNEILNEEEDSEKFIEAKNEEVTAKLVYEKVIGPIRDMNSLSKNFNINFKIPGTLNEAIQISKNNNPELIIAKLEYEQSEKDVIIARSDLSPSATLSLESSKTDDLSSTYDERDKETIKATLSWPIYKGGKKNCVCFIYDENGLIISEVNYKNGEKID